MAPLLDEIELRVLGSLLEKELATPAQYPLSANALTLACNQRSSRNPVMELGERDVVRAADRLRGHGLVLEVDSQGSRVLKYKQNAGARWSLSRPERALLCLLMLRGAQTPGELRGRSGRLCSFGDLGEVAASLERLAAHSEGPLVARLPRSAGRKEARYAHLLSGDQAPSVPLRAAPPRSAPPPSGPHPIARTPPPAAPSPADDRITALQEQVGLMRKELAALRRRFEGFRSEFE